MTVRATVKAFVSRSALRVDEMTVPATVKAFVSRSALRVDEINAEDESVLCAVSSALEHARRCGDLLCQAKGERAHGKWIPWLQAHCPDVTPQTAQRYMRIARHWPELEAANASRVTHLSVREALELLVDKTPRRARYSGDFEWNTPRQIATTVRSVLGTISLDPASTAIANTVVQAERYYSITDDGLERSVSIPRRRQSRTQWCRPSVTTASRTTGWRRTGAGRCS